MAFITHSLLHICGISLGYIYIYISHMARVYIYVKTSSIGDSMGYLPLETQDTTVTGTEANRDNQYT